MLRNPNLVIFGTTYPSNVYAIKNRFVEEQPGYTNVRIYLMGYTTESKQYCFREQDFVLNNLPADASLLTPALYQQKLLEQYPDYILDGTKLSDFTTV